MENVELMDTGSDLGKFSKENVSKIGKIALEAMQKSGKYDKVLEKLNISKETLSMSTPLYATVMSSFIEKRLRPQLVAEQVIKVIDNFDTRGQNALKVPLRDALITASDLPDSGELTQDTGSYGTTTITLTYKYASNRITHEIMKFANADLIAEEMGEIGDALGRKMDSDIISALQTATPSTGANKNYHNSGSTGSFVDYNQLVDASNSARQIYSDPDVLLINPSTMATILKLDEFAGGTSITGALVFKGDETTAFPIPMRILNMRVVQSTQVDDDDVYLVDSKRTGYLVRAGDVETFDGRVSGYLAWEVVGALNYGVAVVQPASVYRFEENTG